MKDLFINRQQELEKLTAGLKRGNDYILIAPRRYGKTSLAERVLQAINVDKNYITIRIDLMRYSGGSIKSVAEGILEQFYLNLLPCGL